MSKCWLSRSVTLTWGGMARAPLPTRQSRLERSSVKWVTVQIQQVWILMSQQMNKSRAQWVIDHTWISLLSVNSFWVIDKPGLWTGPAAALYSVDKRVCVSVCAWFVAKMGVHAHVCVGVPTVQQCVCACVCLYGARGCTDCNHSYALKYNMCLAELQR